MSSFAFLILAFHAITVVSSPYGVRLNGPTATIDSGVVVGTTTSVPSSDTTVNQFLGIPFGEPPERFSPPEAASSWSSAYDASVYKPACIQQFPYTEPQRSDAIKWFNTPPPPAGESEDCLNLNVFAPAGATSDDPKAVLFWIFGGGFLFGSGSLPLYDGSSFAANQDVIVVTANYRTNIFGFPGSPETVRNLGFLDQRLALDWVQRNIAAFGGAPDKVTIFGESAGAGSVDVLVTDPPDPLPFRAAIMESGQGTINANSTDSAESWAKITTIAGCPLVNQLECIRAIPTSDLLTMIEKADLNFFPIHDGGYTWSNTPRQDRLASTDEKSAIARVPILIGTNAQEGKTFTYGMNETGDLLGLVDGITEDLVDLILKTIPIGIPGIATENDLISRVYTELAFQCPAKVVAEESVQVGIDSWRYFFNASFPNTEIFPGSGAYHSSEIGPVYGTYPKEGATELEEDISKVMQKAWADFAKDPIGGPGWDAVPKIAVFGAGSDDEVMAVVDPQVVDSTCFLYKPLIDLESGVVN